MNSTIEQMLSKYKLNTKEECINAIKEVVQEVALSVLSSTDFFEKIAFYGGTALRIFYGLDRFSEDLDFSLLQPEAFDITKYFDVLEEKFSEYELSFKATEKKKTKESAIFSAFLKGNSLEHILTLQPSPEVIKYIHNDEIIKIKFEVDTFPPALATYEYKYGLLPTPYRVRCFDQSSLFAGKLHAIMCRSWKNRVKGRDLYDYLFYVSRNIIPNMEHLKMRLIDSSRMSLEDEFNYDILKKMLIEKFSDIDYDISKIDVMNFISDQSKLDLWSKDLFIAVTESYFQQFKKIK